MAEDSIHFPPPESDDQLDDDDHSHASPVGHKDCEYEHVRSQVNKETRRVQFGRYMVIASILCAGAIVSSLTYVTLSRKLKSDSSDAVSFV